MAAAVDLLIGEFVRTLDERFRLAIPPELLEPVGFGLITDPHERPLEAGHAIASADPGNRDCRGWRR